MTSFRSALSLALLGCAAFAPVAGAITLPGETTIPVMFTHSVDSRKARAGDVVTAKTMQVVLLPNGEQVPKGTLVTGHVVEARPFKFDETPYAVQQASYLSIQIDRVADSPVATSVRALASDQAVEQALKPQRMDETDSPGTMVLVGGAFYGLVMGAFGGWTGDRPLQMIYSGLKVPLLIVLTGVGLFAYLIAWIVIPEAPYTLPERSSAGSAGTGV